MSNETIDSDDFGIKHEFSPMELEAIAKVARTVKQLNIVLAEDDESNMQIEWIASRGKTILSAPSSNGQISF